MSAPPPGHARSPGMSIMSLLSDDNNPNSNGQQPTPGSPLAYQSSPQHQHPHQQSAPAQYATTFSYSQIQPKQYSAAAPPVEYQPQQQQQQHYPPPQQYQTQYQPPLQQASPPVPAQPAAPPVAKPAAPATPAAPAATAPATTATTTAAAKKAATKAGTTAAAAAKTATTTAAGKRKKADDPAPKKGKKKQKKDDAQQSVGSIPIVTGSDDKVTARPKENIPPPPSVPMSPGKKQAQGLDSIGQNKDSGRGSKPEVTLRLRIRLAGGNVKVKPSQSVLKKADKSAAAPELKQYVIDNQEYDFYSTPDKANAWTASADDTTVLNFTRLAEDKYGYDHVHPNQALDLVDDDGEVEDDDEEEEDKEKEEKEMKRRQRVEGKYDLNDPFIDDTETAWEEQQASTQDGFFVYSGPLIEEAPKPVEAKKPAKKPGPKKKTLAVKETEKDTKKKTTPLASATPSTTSTTATTTTTTTAATAEKKA